MRHPLTTFVLVGGLAGSTVAFAAPREADGGQVARVTLATWTRTHAVRGVVSKVDAGSLVITRTRKTPSDLAFSLTPCTLREGTIAVGSTVYVRYRIEGDTLVATAVVVRTSPAAK
jgi:hypothetical protein